MQEAIEYHPSKSPEYFDKRRSFRVVNGKIEEVPLSAITRRNIPEEPRPLPKVEEWEAEGPHDSSRDVKLDLKAITPEQIQEMKQTETKELADAVNNLMAEGEKPAPENKAEALPVLDRMLRATTLEEFNALCDQAQESLNIEGKAFSAAELKQMVSEASEALEKKKIVSAARALEKIPNGPLTQKIEQLVDPTGLMGLMREVRTAYTQ